MYSRKIGMFEYHGLVIDHVGRHGDLGDQLPTYIKQRYY